MSQTLLAECKATWLWSEHCYAANPINLLAGYCECLISGTWTKRRL